jgi:hypothetical protein
MREEVLELMEAARQNPEAAGTPQDFRFKALQVRLSHAVPATDDLKVSSPNLTSLQKLPGLALKKIVKVYLYPQDCWNGRRSLLATALGKGETVFVMTVNALVQDHQNA